MAESLIAGLGIERDLVSLAGAGGKTTLAFAIAAEVRERRIPVVVTTTTRMGVDETGGLTVVPPSVDAVASALRAHGACLAAGAAAGAKVTGVAPAWVDALWRSGVAGVVVVEADGARRKRAKAPAPHEPVIPAASTLVVAVIAADALDRVISDVAHRPLRVAAVAGCGPYDRLTPERAAVVLTNARGGRKGVPDGARFAIAVTGAVGPEEGRARRLAALASPVPVVPVSAPVADPTPHETPAA